MIPLFPLAGAALMLFFGRRLPNAAVNVICVGSVFLSMCLPFGAIFQLDRAARPEQRVSANLCSIGFPPGMMHMPTAHLCNFNAHGACCWIRCRA